ncbi:MFS transporter [candidate division KSB1 bacterium]
MDKIGKKQIFGWVMYDWANSAFATTVMAGFFPIFFKEFWSVGTEPTLSTARLGFAYTLTGLLMALLSPVLGAIADSGSNRKKFLIVFTILGVVMTSSLFFVAQGNWPVAIVVYVLANIGFSGGNIFYDALMTMIAPAKRMDYISSLGFALGYLGGGILFAFNIWMTLNPEIFGLSSSEAAVKVSFITVGLWWTVFSIPMILYVKESSPKESHTALYLIKSGFLRIKKTIKEARKIKTVFLFLIGYGLYIDGVNTIIRMAVDYGISIGFESNDLIIALLITQFIGFPSAIGFGYLGQKIGARKSIFIAIFIYLFITFWGAFMENVKEFFILAIIVGLVQGGIQALSRSFFAKIIPRDKSAEFFGLYNMIGKFTALIGPALIGTVGLLAVSAGFASDTASRISIVSVALLFISGGILFYLVDPEKSKREAEDIT